MARDVFVLDSWPVMEWLKAREPAFSRLGHLLEAAKVEDLYLVMSSLNLGEIYYNSWNEWGEAIAEEILSKLHDLPIYVFHPKQDDVMAAARLKARYKCSYADAFAVVLATEFQASVVTGDRDFLSMRENQAVLLEWWGK